MNNKKIRLGLLILLALFTSAFFAGTSRAAQLYINELFRNDHFIEELQKPIVRVKKPRPAPKPEPEPSPPVQPEAPDKKIALTFDDGPDSENTARILDILKSEQVAATFFVVGERVERYPRLIQRIFAEGHLIANHSHTHSDLAGLTNEEIIKRELDPTSRTVEKLTGIYPKIMRPPYGSLRLDSVDFLRSEGWRIVRWSLDTFDWDPARNDPDQIVQRIIDHHHPNAIVLMHCNGPETVEALPRIIDTLRQLNYEFVTAAQL